MGRRTQKRALCGLMGMALVAGLCLPAQGQETKGATSVLSYGIGGSLGRNLALEPKGSDRTAALRGNLGYVLTRATPTSTLSFGVKADLLAQSPEQAVPQNGLSDPEVTLDYTLSQARSEITLSGRSQRASVSDLSIALDDQGLVTLYEGTGTRAIHRLDFAMRGGIDRPLGYSFALNASGTRYEDTVLPSYYDSDTRSARAGLTAEISPAVTVSTDLAYTRYEAQDDVQTRRETRRATLGASLEIDRLTRVEGSLGHSRIDTRTTSDVTAVQGITGGISLTRADKIGQYALSYERNIGTNGARDTLLFAREADFPLGAVAGRIGLSRAESGPQTWIGGLTATVEQARETLRLDVERKVQTSTQGLDVVVTRASGTLSHGWSARSKIDFGLVASATDEGATRALRADASVSYSRRMTRDVALSVGFVQQLAQETALDDASGQRLFLTLSRDVEWRH